MSYQDLLDAIKQNQIKVDEKRLRTVYDFAAAAHEGQLRQTGDAYITHPLSVAEILVGWRQPQSVIEAALLHDIAEDTDHTLEEIASLFGEEVTTLVDGVTKISRVKLRGSSNAVFVENLRKMFVAMARDIRVILIRLADRFHNMQTLEAVPISKQKRIARETLEVYAPLAERLGMGQLKGDLEDLAFPYVYPKDYDWIKKEIMPKIAKEKEHIERVIKIIRKELTEEKIKIISLHGRQKRLYSLYQKLKKPAYDGDLTKIHDLVALRIIVPTVADCYHALGVIHRHWKPLPGRIKDYIAQPKPNGYQSLHTTVFCDEGKIVEFQIRTAQMHQQAEYGIAAHWHYKEMAGRPKKISDKGYTLPKKFAWIQELVNWQKKIHDHQQYLKSLTIDFFRNRIFVFTPKGDVIDLPEDATPVDFAYHVHSWIGDHCAGAKINGQMSRLDGTLKNGDVVEIITDKNRKGPSRDWLNFVKTSAAKARIKTESIK